MWGSQGRLGSLMPVRWNVHFRCQFLEEGFRVPLSGYFGGHGESVMKDMMSKHGSEMGKRMFYATANKKGMVPKKGKKPARSFKRGK